MTISMPQALMEEIAKAAALNKPRPWLWFMSPNALQCLRNWRDSGDVLASTNARLTTPLKQFGAVNIHEEETWAWGWCLFDADQLRAMSPALLDLANRGVGENPLDGL